MLVFRRIFPLTGGGSPMKRKRFSVEQIVAVLKQGELGMPVADLTRQVGISEQTYYRWKEAICGPGVGPGPRAEAGSRGECSPEEARRRAQPGQGRSSGCPVKKVPRPALMKEVVAYVVSSHGYSELRACRLTKQHRSTQRTPSRRDPMTELRRRMHEIVATRIRYGYRACTSC
jgi:hypothetical protein